MKFRFVWIGKTRDKNWRALQEDYWQRLSHFAKLELVELRESAAHDTRETEGKRILPALPNPAHVVLLDVGGRELTSHELAKTVERWQNQSLREVAFVIGGQNGVSGEVAARADWRLSLSPMTFTHETARVLLLEQLYRAFTIINNHPYQK